MKTPTDEEPKIVIFTRPTDPFKQSAVTGKYINGEWHFLHDGGHFIPMSNIDMKDTELMTWAHVSKTTRQHEYDSN